MSNELINSKSSQCMTKSTEETCKEGTVPKKVTMVLPAYNEEISIGSIVLLTSPYADNVIVVDDGSSDGSSDSTADVARRAGAEVVLHETKKGKDGALKTGFEAVANLGADIIVTMDSDGQHNPAEIPKLVEPIIKGEADMVNSSRYLNGLDRNTPAYRRVYQTVLDRFTNLN